MGYMVNYSIAVVNISLVRISSHVNMSKQLSVVGENICQVRDYIKDGIHFTIGRSPHLFELSITINRQSVHRIHH